MNTYAGKTVYATDNCSDMGDVAFVSHKLKPLYRQWTGDTPEFWTICNFRVKIDEKHKNAKEFYYLWVNDEGALMTSPIVYPDDQVTFGKGYFGFRPVRYIPINGSSVASGAFLPLFNDSLADNNLAMN